MPKREPVLARCAPTSKDHRVLELAAAEAKLERSIEKAYLVLTLGRQRICTAWAQRAPDGLFIWASGDEVWEFFMAGSKQPDEVIRAEVFVEEKTPGAARPDNRSKRRTGHFEVDLVTLSKKESQSQRLVSHFFTPSKATESICSVGKMKLTLVASWVRKGTQTELRKCTKEVRKMVDEVLVEAEQAAVEGQREEPLQPVRLRPKVSQWKRAEPVEDLDDDQRRGLKQELSMEQWASRELWEQRCEAPEQFEMLVPPQELLGEQLVSWRKRLHETKKRSPQSLQRTRSHPPKLGKARWERPPVLGPDAEEKLAKSATWQTSTQGSTTVASPDPGINTSLPSSLGLEALLEDTLNMANAKTGILCDDGTSEVSRFLRQHRHLPQAQQVLSSLPSRPLRCFRAEVRKALREAHGTFAAICKALDGGHGVIAFDDFKDEVLRVGVHFPLDSDLHHFWQSLSLDGRCISVEELKQFLLQKT